MTRSSRWSLLNTAFLTGTLLLALVLVPYKIVVHGLRWSEVAVLAAMFAAVGLAVTAGYHRLFSHRAYQAAAPVRALFLFFGAAAFQNSALKWSSDHRRHHLRVDDPEQDPYAIVKGFWFAHWIWVMEAKDHPLSGVADLQKDGLVRFQHRHTFLIGALAALLPLGVGLATGNVFGHLVMGVLLRIVLTHHSTFLINSAAHWFGSRPYTDANSARDNWVLAPLTFGEGYHNFHHMWQWDYRNGARWYQVDPTKWLILALRWAGLVDRLRRVPEAVIQRARIAMEEQRLALRLAAHGSPASESLRLRLAQARARIESALQAVHERHEAWEAAKRQWQGRQQARAEHRRAARAEWQAAMLRHRAELQAAWREWRDARLAVRRLDFA